MVKLTHRYFLSHPSSIEMTVKSDQEGLNIRNSTKNEKERVCPNQNF